MRRRPASELPMWLGIGIVLAFTAAVTFKFVWDDHDSATRVVQVGAARR